MDSKETVSILKREQADFYMLHGVMPVKVTFSDYNDSKNRMVFHFNKEETYHVWRLWKMSSGW